MICQPCREAADTLAEAGFIDEPHDPAICVNAGHTDQDIHLFGRKCPCQHGRNGTNRNGGQQTATEGNEEQ